MISNKILFCDLIKSTTNYIKDIAVQLANLIDRTTYLEMYWNIKLTVDIVLKKKSPSSNLGSLIVLDVRKTSNNWSHNITMLLNFSHLSKRFCFRKPTLLKCEEIMYLKHFTFNILECATYYRLCCVSSRCNYSYTSNIYHNLTNSKLHYLYLYSKNHSVLNYLYLNKPKSAVDSRLTTRLFHKPDCEVHHG